MAKIKRFSKNEGWKNGEGWAHYCPACKETHGFATEIPFANGSKWTFNGNMEAPTFAPSMNIRIGPYPDGEDDAGRIDVCHYFLRNGRIEFLADCTHEMRGQTVDLPDLP